MALQGMGSLMHKLHNLCAPTELLTHCGVALSYSVDMQEANHLYQLFVCTFTDQPVWCRADVT